MKQKITIIILYIVCFNYAIGQEIKAPEGFKLVKPDGVKRQINHYVKDNYTFMFDNWTGSVSKNPLKFDAEIAKFLSENYRTSLTDDIHFSKGIYYGLAHYSKDYVFIILHKNWVYKFSSPNIDENFEKYCNLLLSEAKKPK